MKKLHILTVNSQGLGDKQKRGRFYLWVKQQKGNIILVQETHFTKSTVPYVKSEWKGEVIHSFGTTKSCGVAIFITNNVTCEILDTYNDEEGRIALVNLQINDIIYTIVNIYAPNIKTKRSTFFKNLNKIIETHSLGIAIVGGDWNDIQHPTDRKSRVKCKQQTQSNIINKFKKECHLIDPWRLKNPMLQQFTWKRKNVNNEASRIDFFLVHRNILSKILTTDIRPVLIKYTDHQAVSLVLNINHVIRGPGYWKLNNSLLNDENYQKSIINILNKYNNLKKDEKMTSRRKWDLCKIEIREYSILFGKQKSKLRKDKIQDLECKLKILTEQNANEDDLKLLTQQIENLYSYKATGSQIRARAKWIEQGEKNTKYFLSLEKGRQLKKSINKIYNEKGELLENQDDILRYEKYFYEKMYTSKNTNIEEINNYMSNIDFNHTLSEEESLKCEGLVQEKECIQALKKMKLNKSPGSDGLTVEFYKTFWPYLKHLLIDCLAEGFTEGKLAESQRIGILSLMFKKNDPNDLNNWRPLTLLNIDYKILAHCLAERIKPLLPKIINTDQNGFIKGRNITFNIRLIQDIIDYAEKSNITGAILFLDFAKAFDTVEWEFMFSALRNFGFKDSFMKWISILYTDISCLITNNGWFSEPVKITRGIRQGCPISALLFVITVEILAMKIRQNENIHGIQIKQSQSRQFKISQLADDTTLFLKTKTDITASLNLIEVFGSLSGLILNRGKSQGLKFGNNKTCIEDNFENINWSVEEIKALGIFFGINLAKTSKMNWDNKVEKIIKIVNKWKKRKLTMIGRIQIVKSLLIPQLTYLIAVLSVPQNVVKKIESILYDFIWDGNDKIKRRTMCRVYNAGGLNTLDLSSYILSIHVSWVKKLKDNVEDQWKVIPKHYLNQFGNNLLIFSMNLHTYKNVEGFHNIPTFYQDIIKAWLAIGGGNRNYPLTITDIGSEIIWGNQYIKYKNKTLIFQDWINSNIIIIKDLLDHEGKINEIVILNSLQGKQNWISQMSIVKKSIPRMWQEKLRNSDIVKYNLKTDYKTLKVKLLHSSKMLFDLNNLTNKGMYKSLVTKHSQKPIAYIVWENTFLHISKSALEYKLEQALIFVFTKIEDNRIKVFRWKLIHRILTNNQIMYKWKVKDSPLCTICGVVEDYEHFFIKCKCLKSFIIFINTLFHAIGFCKNMMTLDNIVCGYKIGYEKYTSINYLLTYISYSIYKGYYMSDNKTKNVSFENILKHELHRAIRTNYHNKSPCTGILRNACNILGINPDSDVP